MGRQREQMTLNNPDILFIHLSAAWKDGIFCNEISHVESIMRFEYSYACVCVYYVLYIIASFIIPLIYTKY